MIEDIAHALSQVCRFTGHCKFFYSVAQHSIHTATILRDMGLSRKVQLRGLLHDASESYLCDIAAPVKPYLDGYREQEDVLQGSIYTKYNLDNMLESELQHVKNIDMLMVRLEGETLMKLSRDWSLPYPNPKQTLRDWVVPIPKIEYVDPRVIENQFLGWFYSLHSEVLN